MSDVRFWDLVSVLKWTMFRAQIRPDVDLRLLEERHAGAVFAVVDQNREYLREWLPWVDATVTEDDTLSFIRSSLEQFAANHGFAAGIWKQDHYIGGMGTQKIDWMHRKVEIGYWISQSFQGQGIVTDACRAVLDHAFDDWDLNRVEIRCAAGNTKSSAIAERLGFTLDGTLREGHLLHHRFHDLLVFGMLKTDWLSAKKPI
jgi:ribosomal-protein-serine acetyltransferase